MILSFKPQFIQPILSGDKIHTIREDKHNRWKPGNKIHFATGTRTKHYNQFYDGVCVSVQAIVLVNHGNHVYCNIQTGEKEYIHNDCVEHEPNKWRDSHIRFYRGSWARPAGDGYLLGDLCKNDGLSWEDFKNWFVPKQGDKFEGKIIHWTEFRYAKKVEADNG